VVLAVLAVEGEAEAEGEKGIREGRLHFRI